MQRYDETTEEPTSRYLGRPGSCVGGHGSSAWSRDHALAAHALAIEDGLLRDEVEEILAGRGMTAAFPVGWREGPEDYAVRAVAEMMVAYLAFEGAPVDQADKPWRSASGRDAGIHRSEGMRP